MLKWMIRYILFSLIEPLVALLLTLTLYIAVKSWISVTLQNVSMQYNTILCALSSFFMQ